MQTERRLVRLADGRDIEFLTAGPEDGLPLVVHEGTPIGLALNARLATAAWTTRKPRSTARLRGVDS
jgi:hypothetical protein